MADTAKPPAAGKGRPKGALNKTTRIAKEAIAYAAQGLGGADRLVAWAKEDGKNEAAFWTSIYPRLLPLEVNADVSATISEVRHRIIDGATD